MGKTLAVSFFLLCFVAGSFGANDDTRNQTIECVFAQYSSCYSAIAPLGANFSAKYDQTEAEVNYTCRSSVSAQKCLGQIAGLCGSRVPAKLLQNINNTIANLCANTTSEHKGFLNSSFCYNRNLQRRQNCMKKYDPGSKTDAKTLCCSNARQLRCLHSDMSNVCPKNTTAFQDALMETFRSHQTLLCQPYVNKYCKGGAAVARPASALFALLSGVVAWGVRRSRFV